MFRSAQHPDRRSLDLVGAEDFGPWLDLEDEIDSITKSEQGLRWDQVVVPPGDSLIARVPGNSDLRITYRRAGFWGFAERRVISIHGRSDLASTCGLLLGGQWEAPHNVV